MKPNDRLNAQLHKRLPIDDEEQILAVFRHHWFAYFSLWTVALVLVIAIMTIAAFLSMQTVDTTGTTVLATHRTAILVGAGILSAVVLLFCGIPVWLRMQEQLVLTDEALLQLLQPSLFASKISQLSLQHVADASVRRDFFGTILGYGKITIETPGEQDNYEFLMVPQPESVVKQIITAHENYISALESGRLPTTWRGNTMQPTQSQPAPVQLSAEEYQKFLQYQQQMGQSTAAPAPVAPDGTSTAAPTNLPQ